MEHGGAIPPMGGSKKLAVETNPISKTGAPPPAEELAPNISLNIHAHGGSKISDLAFVALVGIVLQFGYLVFVGAGVYHPSWKKHFLKEGEPVGTYAYPILAIGTVSIVLGMIICSDVVERSTVETRWVAGSKYLEALPAALSRRSTRASLIGRTPGFNINNESKLGARLLWLQKNHTVGDQIFESFVMFAQGKRESVMMSHRRQLESNETDVSSRRSRSRKGRTAFWQVLASIPKKAASNFEEGFTLLGTFLSITGFVLQFTGAAIP